QIDVRCRVGEAGAGPRDPDSHVEGEIQRNPPSRVAPSRLLEQLLLPAVAPRLRLVARLPALERLVARELLQRGAEARDVEPKREQPRKSIKSACRSRAPEGPWSAGAWRAHSKGAASALRRAGATASACSPQS